MVKKALCLTITALLVCVRADYQVEVRFFSYWNPSHRRNNGECCDGGGECGDNYNDFCDNVFLICLNEDTRPIIPCTPELSLVEQDRDAVVPNNDSLTFEEGPDGLLGLPNPVVINISGPWPNDSLTELTIVVYDADGMMSEDLRFIGDFRINITTLSPGDSTGLMQFDSFRPPGGLHANLNITVQCAENFYGVDCSRVCVDTDSELGHYTCDSQGFIVCSEGYRNTSTNCNECIPDDGCSDVGGYCEGPGDCFCLANYTGEFCEVDLDPCAHTTPCQNRATCMNSGDGRFDCACREGFEGERCQSVRTDECDPDPCQNGATCVDLLADYLCTCLAGYSGKNCSSNDDDCQLNPCLNGGNCTDLLADYMCTCLTGYSGKDCGDMEGEKGSQSDSSGVSTAVLAGGVGGVAVLLLIIIILTIALVVGWRRKISSAKLKLQVDQDLDPKANEAYGTSSAPIPLTDNEAYKSVQHNGSPEDDEGYVINQLTYNLPHSTTATPAAYEQPLTKAASRELLAPPVATAPNVAYGEVKDPGADSYEYITP